MNAASEPQEAAPPPRKRRGRRLLIGSVLVLGLILVLGPIVAGPFVKGKVLGALGDNLNGDVQLTGVSFNLLGSVGMDGLSIADANGAPVLSLEKVRGKVGLLSLLHKRYDARLVAEGFELHVRRQADGSINLEGLGKQQPERERTGGSKQGGGKETEGEGDPVPNVGLDFRLTRGRLVIHGQDGDTELRDLEMEFAVDRLDAPGRMSMSVRPYGPSGPGGLIKAHGTFQLAENGRFRPGALRADLQFLLQDLDLAAFAPAARAFGDVEALAGSLQASATLRIDDAGLVRSESSVDLTGLRASGGAAGGEGLKLDNLRWRSSLDLNDSWAGAQRFSLAADDFLDVEFVGSSGSVRRESGEVVGELTVDARMTPLLEALRGVLPVREGMAFEGRFAGSANFVAGVSSGSLQNASSAGGFGMQEFRVRDAQGQPVDLGGLESFRFDYDGSLQPQAGAAELVRLELAAGPITATGHGAVRGLKQGGEPVLDNSEIVAVADLDRLAKVLDGFLDLGATRFGGRLDLRTTARQDGGAVLAESRMQATGLFFESRGADGAPQKLGPLAMEFAQRARLELGAGGVSRFDELSLKSEFLDLTASGEFTDLIDAEKIRGKLTHRGTLRPERAVAVFGAWAGDLALRGEAIALQGNLGVDGGKWTADGSVDSPGLRLLDAAYGPDGRAVPAFRTAFDAAGGAAGAPITSKFDLASAGISVKGSGSVQTGAAVAGASEWTMTIDLRPGEVARGFADWLEGLTLEGEPLGGTLTLATRDGGAHVKADLKGSRLLVELPPVEPEPGMPAATEPR
ncbi:MAG TPA: hypothetical protein VGC54_11235, partial [Planctomycetota bacterium]